MNMVDVIPNGLNCLHHIEQVGPQLPAALPNRVAGLQAPLRTLLIAHIVFTRDRLTQLAADFSFGMPISPHLHTRVVRRRLMPFDLDLGLRITAYCIDRQRLRRFQRLGLGASLLLDHLIDLHQLLAQLSAHLRLAVLAHHGLLG